MKRGEMDTLGVECLVERGEKDTLGVGGLLVRPLRYTLGVGDLGVEAARLACDVGGRRALMAYALFCAIASVRGATRVVRGAISVIRGCDNDDTPLFNAAPGCGFKVKNQTNLEKISKICAR